MLPQEEAREEVLQQAIMALARAVQQMESRSLARLDDLDARLGAQQQPNSELPGDLPTPPYPPHTLPAPRWTSSRQYAGVPDA